MRTLFAGDLHVSYSQFYLSTGDWTSEDMEANFAGQVNGLCGAGVAEGLWLITGLHTGTVPVTVEEHDGVPPVDDAWEEVVEASCAFAATTAFLGWDDGSMIEVPAGPLRVRYCAVGMDAGRAADVRSEDEPEIDRYLLQLWPAPPAPDAVLRQTSEIAAYWHDVARAGPSAAEVAARRSARDAERRERHRIQRERAAEEQRGWYDEQIWGGPRPADPLGSLPAAAPVAKVDLALAEELARLEPGARRSVACWAARTAVGEAGLDRVGWIAAAVDALDAGLPLPFGEPHAAFARVSAEPAVEHRIVASPDGLIENLSQQAMGFYALVTAAQEDPTEALFSAVHQAQLTYGRHRLPVLHAALRTHLARLRTG